MLILSMYGSNMMATLKVFLEVEKIVIYEVSDLTGLSGRSRLFGSPTCSNNFIFSNKSIPSYVSMRLETTVFV